MVLGSVWQQQMGGAYSPREGQKGGTSSAYQTSTTGKNGKPAMPAKRITPLAVLLLAVFLIGSFPIARAQSSKKPALDTIFLTSGKWKVGTLKNIFGSSVYYVDTLGKEHALKERNVHRIVYSTGRSQSFNQMAVSDAAEGDWRVVMLVDDPAQVEGLYARGVVSGKSSPSNKTKRSAQRSAETRIKKRCAAKGGIVVLVTKRLSTGGYGETPSLYIEGEAYGTEPLEEGQEGDEGGASDSTEE